MVSHLPIIDLLLVDFNEKANITVTKTGKTYPPHYIGFQTVGDGLCFHRCVLFLLTKNHCFINNRTPETRKIILQHIENLELFFFNSTVDDVVHLRNFDPSLPEYFNKMAEYDENLRENELYPFSESGIVYLTCYYLKINIRTHYLPNSRLKNPVMSFLDSAKHKAEKILNIYFDRSGEHYEPLVTRLEINEYLKTNH